MKFEKTAGLDALNFMHVKLASNNGDKEFGPSSTSHCLALCFRRGKEFMMHSKSPLHSTPLLPSRLSFKYWIPEIDTIIINFVFFYHSIQSSIKVRITMISHYTGNEFCTLNFLKAHSKFVFSYFC